VSGTNVMKGYWKKPRSNERSDGSSEFLRTGDVGYRYADATSIFWSDKGPAALRRGCPRRRGSILKK